MMLIAGIFQGYDNQALAHTATAFSKELGMTPAALAPAFTAGYSAWVGALLFGQLEDRIGRRPAFMASRSILVGFTLVTPFAKSILRYQGSGCAEFLRSSHRSSLSLSP